MTQPSELKPYSRTPWHCHGICSLTVLLTGFIRLLAVLPWSTRTKDNLDYIVIAKQHLVGYLVSDQMVIKLRRGVLCHAEVYQFVYKNLHVRPQRSVVFETILYTVL